MLRTLSAGERAAFPALGASCHSVEEAWEAVALGATYLTAGHVFATTCKAGLPGRGVEFLAQVCAAVPCPVYAIGGVGPENLPALARAGAKGGCVRSPLMTCPDPGPIFASGRRQPPMSFDPKLLQLYAVTDRQWTGRQTLIQQLEAALQGGVTLVQLREKDLDDAAFLAEARKVVALCHRYGVPCLINDNLPWPWPPGQTGSTWARRTSLWRTFAAKWGPISSSGPPPKPWTRPWLPRPPGRITWGWGPASPPHQTQRQGDHPGGAGGHLRRRIPPGGGHWGNHPPECRQLQGAGMAGLAVISALFAAPDITAAARDLLALSRHLTEGGAP